MTRSRKILWALAVFVVGYIGYGALPDAGEMLSGAREKDNERTSTLDQIRLADEAILANELFLTELEQLRIAVPRDPDLPAVIAALDRTVKNVGMRWTSGAPSPQDAGLLEGGNGQWQLSMTVSGDISRVPILLRELRDLERLVTIDSVQVRTEGTGVTAQLSVRFFALPGDPLAFPEQAPVSDESQGVPTEGN